MPRGPTCARHDLDRLIDAAATIRSARSSPRRCATRSSAPTTTARIDATEPRERLWRALTPQVFRRGALRARWRRHGAGVAVTDEAMAMERQGPSPLLVEGREDNFKVTTPADLALAEFLLVATLIVRQRSREPLPIASSSRRRSRHGRTCMH